MLLVAAAVLGLVFGSFLNVLITRLPEGESIATPRSHCRNCDHTIPWCENFPVVSWLALGGKCRACRTPIPWRYPLVEAALATLWCGCLLSFGVTLLGLRAAVFCFILLGLVFMDLETLLLPDWLTLPGIVLGILFASVAGRGLHGVISSLAGATLGGGILLLVSGAYYLVRRRHGIGMGDVKLLAMIGAFLGPAEVLLVLVTGTVVTAAAAILWLLARLAIRRPQETAPGQRSWAEYPMPYGTFLAAGGIFFTFFGARFLHWYLSLYR